MNPRRILLFGVLLGAFASRGEAWVPHALAAPPQNAGPGSSSGTLTLSIPGFVSNAKVRSFTLSGSMDDAHASTGAGTGKPQLSRLSIERDAGVGSVKLTEALTSGRAIPNVELNAIGAKITLSEARVEAIANGQRTGGSETESLSISFAKVTIEVVKPGDPVPARLSFDQQGRDAAIAGGPITPLKYVYLDPAKGNDRSGVDPAALSIDSYEYSMISTGSDPRTGQGSGKVSAGPISFTRRLSAETLDEVRASLSGRRLPAVRFDFPSRDKGMTRSIALQDAVITSWSLSAHDDGSVSTQISMGYSKIELTRGTERTTWDTRRGTR